MLVLTSICVTLKVNYRLLVDNGVFGIYDNTNGQVCFRCFDNSFSALYNDGVEKLRTTTTGATVTGIARANEYRSNNLSPGQASVDYGMNNNDNTGMYYRSTDGYNQIAFSIDSGYVGGFGRDSSGNKAFYVGSSNINPIVFGTVSTNITSGKTY